MQSAHQNQNSAARWSYVALAVGTILGFFMSGRWTIAAAAWLAPVFLLYFTRRQRPWFGYLVVALISFVAVSVSWYGMQPLPLPAYLAMMLVGAATGSLPYLFDRLLAPRLLDRHGRPRFAGTLIFPLAATAIEFVFMISSPLGSFGAMAYSQYGNLPLLQLLSVGGLWLVALLVSWLAPVANWAWEMRAEGRSARNGLLTYAAVMLAVVTFGAYRLWSAPAATETVPIAGFTAVALDFEELIPLFETDLEAFRA